MDISRLCERRIGHCFISAATLAFALNADETFGFGQVRERHTRTIQFNARPIVEQLRADDDIVIVRWDRDVAVSVPAPATPLEALKEAVGAPAFTAVIVTVTGVSGVLALENSWIHTKFVATVDEVLASGVEVNPRDRVTPREAIEFHVHGGEVAVQGTIVRGSDVVNYPINRKYLVFLGRKTHENGWAISSEVPLLIDGDRVVAVSPAASQLTGLKLEEIRNAIRQRR